MSKVVVLLAGFVLTVTAGDIAASIKQVEDATVGAILPALTARTFGPYLVEREFIVSDGATVSTAVADVSKNIAGLLTMSDGAPVSAVRAALAVNPAGDDNSLTFTARAYGAEGDRITIEYVDPAANDAELAVSVSGNTVVVSLATGVAGAITSTAAEVLAAIEASIPATRLVSVALDAADSGGADDGSGIVTAMTAAPLADGAGTGIGVALPGGICIDTTDGVEYRNTGTTAAPVWTASVTTAAYAATAATVNALAALHLYGAGVPVDYTDGTPPATGEGTAPPGALYSVVSGTGAGDVYRNDGTQAQPAWIKLGDVVI